MTLLLDTHAWLWSKLEPQRLSPSLRNILVDPGTAVALSPVSLWEALLLARRGRVRLDPDPATWIRHALAARPIEQLPVTFDIALASRHVRLDNEDPADRFIAATAKVHDLTLVTADRALLRCPDIRTLPGA